MGQLRNIDATDVQPRETISITQMNNIQNAVLLFHNL